MKRYVLEQKPEPGPKLAPVINLDAERRARRRNRAAARRVWSNEEAGHSKRV
jgi:hypothetical protein